MKKVILGIFLALGILLIPNIKVAADELPTITDHEKVKVYFFRGDGCGHCYDYLTYFSKNYNKYKDYFEFVIFESWKESGNTELLYDVKEYFGEEADSSVPFTAIGSDYSRVGYNSDEIIEAALEAYQDESYEDYIGKMIEEGDYEVKAETLEEACAAEGITVRKESDSAISDGAIVAIIFGILIVGFGALVVFSRKK